MEQQHDDARSILALGAGASFRAMLPQVISVEELQQDGNGGIPRLFPRESSHAATFAPERRREFAWGRQCARAALKGLGFSAMEVPVGPSREPVWPAGVCGSISHASSAWAAAAALRSDLHALGLDIDTDDPLPEGAAEEIVRRDEHSSSAPRGMPVELWEKVVFSAKESVFKAWFPITGSWLGFLDCRIAVAAGGELVAEVVAARPATWPKQVVGAWSVSSGCVRTAVWIETT